jgi:hypothetical protein
MSNPSDSYEVLIQNQMGWQIGGGPIAAFHNFALKIGNDQILRFHPVIGNATRLDNDKSIRARDATSITKGI